jgi:hypothetical protein
MTSHPGHRELQLVNNHLLHNLAINAAELVKQHPPRFHNGNKKLVYQLMCPKGPDSHHGRLEYTRWMQFELPETIAVNQRYPTTLLDGFFTYDPPSPNAQESHWHMNFADRQVFFLT